MRAKNSENFQRQEDREKITLIGAKSSLIPWRDAVPALMEQAPHGQQDTA